MTRREISRLMVANRGEIALRIMRTCHEMGIETVAVYGDGEEDAQHTRMRPMPIASRMGPASHISGSTR